MNALECNVRNADCRHPTFGYVSVMEKTTYVRLRASFIHSFAKRILIVHVHIDRKMSPCSGITRILWIA